MPNSAIRGAIPPCGGASDSVTLQDRNHAAPSLRPLVGNSAWARGIQQEISCVAPFSSSVLISGPSGTGKELIARAIHGQSPRVEAPFVPVNCAAVSGTLFESHMFGHLKGAFTGSNYAALGCFRAADSGTIFLDEVGELDPAMQAKLLRVLQEGTVVPVGSHEEQQVDVRVVAATNRDLLSEVRAGNFREDLYYRLAVITLKTLPLRSRSEDIEPVADYLLASQSVKHGLPFKPMSEQALSKLQSYCWPGNVRELQNVLERAMMLARGDLIGPGDIHFDVESEPSTAESLDTVPVLRAASGWHFPRDSEGAWPTLEVCEREFIAATLEQAHHNQAAAARLLNLDRSVLRRRIKKLGIQVDQTRPSVRQV